jgi:Fe-S cluster assembly protein SufD
VKCSHGSTTGKVNEDEIYYLTTRGFSRPEAKLLIAQGLFAELVDEAPAFLRDEVDTLVACSIGADADLGVCKDPV